MVISKLPNTIDTQSVRISGLNPSATRGKTYLSDVVCSVSEDDDESSEVIHALEVKRSTLREEKNVLAAQAEILLKYANTLTGEHASPDVMNEFLGAFAEHGRSNIKSVSLRDFFLRRETRTLIVMGRSQNLKPRLRRLISRSRKRRKSCPFGKVPQRWKLRS